MFEIVLQIAGILISMVSVIVHIIDILQRTRKNKHQKSNQPD